MKLDKRGYPLLKKKCTVCKKRKSLDKFYLRNIFYYDSECKMCHNKRMRPIVRKWRIDNRESFNKYHREYKRKGKNIMKNPSQRDRVVGQIMKNGQISRNECLQQYITRLAAIIYDLRKEGWEFTEKTENGNYFYVVESTCPAYVKEKSRLEQVRMFTQ